MENFGEIKKGDTVYLIEIHDSELPKENAIKELEVVSVDDVRNTCHLRLLLSDSTLITPSKLFPFHSISRNERNGELEDINEEIYAVDKMECIRIASNLFKLKMKRTQKIMDECKDFMSKLGRGTISLLELKMDHESEVVAETVVV